MTRFVRRAFNHPERRELAEYIARVHGVTVEHLLETIRLRKAYKRSAMYRRRSRRRVLALNPGARRQMIMNGRASYANEGALHALLREAGISGSEFARLVGMRQETFARWYGHPLQPWPIEFLKLYIKCKRMEKALEDRGIPTEQFRATAHENPLPPMPTGRYPRTAEQFKMP